MRARAIADRRRSRPQPIAHEPIARSSGAVDRARGVVERQRALGGRADRREPQRRRRAEPPSKPRDQRERKYVYVLAGHPARHGGARAPARRARRGAAGQRVLQGRARRRVQARRAARRPAAAGRRQGRRRSASSTRTPTTGSGGETMCASSSGCRSRARTMPAARSSSRSRWSTRSTASAPTSSPSCGSRSRSSAASRWSSAARTRPKPSDASFDIEEATAAFAHKLARQARGAEILVGGRVFRAARAEWNFEALPAIDLPDEAPGGTQREQVADRRRHRSGRQARAGVPPARPQGARAAAARARATPTRLHGRDLELKALRDAWRDVLVTKRKRQIVIVGDAGVGKRTLVRTFLEGIAPRRGGRDPHDRARRHRDDAVRRDRRSRARRARPRRGCRAARGRAPPAARAAADLPRRGDARARRAPRCRSSACCSARAAPRPAAEIDAETRRQTLMQLLDAHRAAARGRQADRSSSARTSTGPIRTARSCSRALLKVDTPRPILGLMTSPARAAHPQAREGARHRGRPPRRAARRRAPPDARRAVRARPRHRRARRADRRARRRQRVLHPGAARHADRARHPRRPTPTTASTRACCAGSSATRRSTCRRPSRI